MPSVIKTLCQDSSLDCDAANSPSAAALIRGIDAPGVEIGLLSRKVRDDWPASGIL
jgi:hypothetical protein